MTTGKVGRYLRAVALLAFILTAGFFISGCGGEITIPIPGLANVTVSFDTDSYNITEGESVTVMVTLSEDPERDIEIQVMVGEESTAADGDYSLEPASVTFASGDTGDALTKSITLTATDDSVYEGNETLVLNFGTSLPLGVTAGATLSATVTIVDNDDPTVTASFGAPAYSVTEGEEVAVVVTLSRDPERDVEIPVIADTTTSTALPTDYSPLPESVMFTSGETSKEITFAAVDDTADERQTETVILNLGTLPEGITAGTTTSTTVTITDNDYPAVTVSFDANSYSVTEGAMVVLALRLSAEPGREVVIPVMADMTSTAVAADYSGLPESVTFASGETSKEITLTATNDPADEEESETLVISFGMLPDGVTPGALASATVMIADNDDPPVMVSFGAPAYPVTEGGTVDVTVTLSADPERSVEIPLVVDTITSTAVPADYTVPESVTFTAGEMTKNITVAAIDDPDDEDEIETVIINFGTPPDGVSTGGLASTTVNIADNDDPRVTVSFGADSYDVTEGGTVDVAVTLSVDPEREVVIPLVVDTTSTALPEDYTVPESVTFASGEMTKNITVAAMDDDADEDENETLILDFGTITDERVTRGTPARTTVNIEDNDDPEVRVSFGTDSYNVTEGGTAVVTVTLSADPERDVEISLVTTGTAGTEDYSGVPESVTFASGDTGDALTKSFTVAAMDDSDDEAENETVVINFEMLPDRVLPGTRSTTTVNIADDDDPLVTVLFGAVSYDVTEGESVTVTVTLSSDPERSLVIPLVATGTAGSGDYSGVPDNVTFASGDTGASLTKSFTVATTDDDADEDEIETVIINFGTFPDNRVTAVAPETTTVNIEDDDDPRVSVSFGTDSYNVTEGGTVDVTVTLSVDPERSVTIPVTVDTTGTAGTGDYSGVPATVTFTAGETTKDITVTATNDDADEDENETLILNFGTITDDRVTEGTPATTTVNIADDDDPRVSVSFGADSYNVTEGGTVDVTVTLSVDPERSVTIPVTVDTTGTAGTGDYSGVPATVTFTAGETTKDITVTATNDDADEDENETLILNFGTITDDRVTEGTPATTTVNIADDDDPRVSVSFGADSYNVTEDGTVDVTVTLSADPERSVTIPLVVDTTMSTATQTTDYTGVPASVTFSSGDTGDALTKSFTVTATDDDADEDENETLILDFGTITDGRVTEGTPATTTVNIADDDDPRVEVSFGTDSYNVTEGDTVDVTVTLSVDPERSVTIPLVVDTTSTAIQTTDYTGVPATVTFTAGETTKDITVTATNDDADEDENETLILDFGTITDERVTEGTPATTTVNIADDDDPRVSVSFGADEYGVAEGGTVDVTVTLSADPERSLVIPVIAGDGGTAGTGDYSGLPTSVTFASGDTGDALTKSITVTATNDDADEDENETLILDFGTLPDGRVTEGTPATTTVNIADNDDPRVEVSFGAADYSVTEGGTVDVTVTLSVDPERSVTIPVTVDSTSTAATEDYLLEPTSVTFTAGETTKDITVTATDDPDDEAENETLVLDFGTITDERVTEGTPATTTVNIADNDDPPVTVSFGATSYNVTEGGTVDVTVTLNADPERNVEIQFTVSGTANPEDYSLPASVTFASGDTTKNITVAATDDPADEPNETLIISFAAPLPDRVTSVTPSSTTVTIEDNDVEVSFGAASYDVAEGGESVVVTVTLSSDPERSVVVPIEAGPTSSAGSGDYSGVPADVTFASGDTTKSITVGAVDDAVDDDDEVLVLVFGTLPEGVSRGTMPSADVTIADNDAPDPPVVSCDSSGPGFVVLPANQENYDLSTSGDPDPDTGYTICGNELDNTIKAAGGDDTVLGRGGDDTLQGREGDDIIDGAADEDTVVYWIVDEADGTTLLDEALDISLENGKATDGHGGTDTITRVENVRCEGTVTADNNRDFNKIVGDRGGNKIWGCNNPGADDLLIGRAGGDTFVQSSGDSYLDGGTGSDTLDCSECPASISIDLRNLAAGRNMGPDDRDYADIGNNNYAIPENGDFTAGGGDSTIENVIGGRGGDSLVGDADDNTLRDGSAGVADTLTAHAGDDTYYAEHFTDTVTEVDGEGDDSLYYTNAAAVTQSLTYTEIVTNEATAQFTPPHIETVYGTAFDDTLRAAAGDVTLVGGEGDDTLIGGDGENTLIGCAGQNTFYSNTGDSGSGDDPYALPSGDSCTDTTCDGSTTFVLVYNPADDSPQRIQRFRQGDSIILAGFPNDSGGGGRPSVGAFVALVNEVPSGWTDETDTSIGTNRSATWVKFAVNGQIVAFIEELGFPTETIETGDIPFTDAPPQVLANRLNNVGSGYVTVMRDEPRCNY